MRKGRRGREGEGGGGRGREGEGGGGVMQLSRLSLRGQCFITGVTTLLTWGQRCLAGVQTVVWVLPVVCV